jgi:hypothetical protein
MPEMRRDYKMDGILRDLPYLGRLAWVSFKEIVGLPRWSDRTFYVDRFVRALRKGTLGRKYGIMATSWNDGAGSQAQAAMSAICFAEAFGLEYIHRPFATIAKPEGEMSEWVRQWEDYFNFGYGARPISACRQRMVPLDELLMAPGKWPSDAIVVAPHYLHFCNKDARAWEHALPLLRAKFRQNKPQVRREGFTIAVHVRRGDVALDNKRTAGKFTPDAVYIRTLESIMEIVATKIAGAKILIFSQGDPAIFKDFERLGCELRLDEPAIDTHRQLVQSDVLVMSKGGFSYTAGVLNTGLVLYAPQKYRSLEHWLVRAADGSFDAKRFDELLDGMLARRSLSSAARENT